VTDRELVEWVAHAQIGVALPPEYQDGSNGRTIVQRLINIGVMPEPPAGMPLVDVMREATSSAWTWLEKHPD